MCVSVVGQVKNTFTNSNIYLFQSLEYFLYAGLMMIGILIFMIFARHFQERENPQRETV